MSRKIFPVIAPPIALIIGISGCAGTGETQPAPQPPRLDAASIIEAAPADPQALQVLGLGGAVAGVLALLLLGASGAARRVRRSRRKEHPRPGPSLRTARGKRAALLAGAVTCGAVAIAVASSWRDLQIWWRLHRDFERLGDNAQGYPEYRDRKPAPGRSSRSSALFEVVTTYLCWRNVVLHDESAYPHTKAT